MAQGPYAHIRTKQPVGGLIYQTVVISKQYFAYSTSSEVTVSNSRQSELEIPAITYCSVLYQVLNASLLNSAGFCNIRDTNSLTEVNKCINKRNLLDRFSRKDLLKYSIHWKVETNKFRFTKQKNKENLTKFNFILKRHTKCSTNSIRGSSPMNTQRIVGQINVKTFYPLKPNGNDIMIYLHDNRWPLYHTSNLKIVKYKLNSGLFFLTYTLYKTIRPSTPSNQCIDYPKGSSFKSRDHCLQQCQLIRLQKLCYEKLKLYKRLNCTYEDLNKNFFFYNDHDLKPRMFPGIEECDQCPFDCKTLMYLPAEPLSEEKFPLTNFLPIRSVFLLKWLKNPSTEFLQILSLFQPFLSLNRLKVNTFQVADSVKNLSEFIWKFVWIHPSSQFIRILYKINIRIRTKFQLFLQLFRSFWSWWDHDDVNSEIRWQSLSLIIIISLSRSRSTRVSLSPSCH